MSRSFTIVFALIIGVLQGLASASDATIVTWRAYVDGNVSTLLLPNAPNMISAKSTVWLQNNIEDGEGFWVSAKFYKKNSESIGKDHEVFWVQPCETITVEYVSESYSSGDTDCEGSIWVGQYYDDDCVRKPVWTLDRSESLEWIYIILA